MMRTVMPKPLPAIAASLLIAGPVYAMNVCQLPDGSKVYTDQKCSNPGLEQAKSPKKPLPTEALPGVRYSDGIAARATGTPVPHLEPSGSQARQTRYRD
jgi:hypothetical protein